MECQELARCLAGAATDMGFSGDLKVVGCDSTNLNTGTKGGVLRHLELLFGRPLQRFICMLHTNELPLRHLFLHLDGPTTGDTTFSGPIGRLIERCETMPVVNFVSIADGDGLPSIPLEVFQDLSTDQKYLYGITEAIRHGHVPSSLANQNPGHISHARWLTLANRICRLYVATANPNHKLYALTYFVITNYSPLWFNIKCKPLCTDGPRHLFRSLQLLKLLPDSIAAVVKPYISRNAYFAHPKNIMLSMLADTDNDKRAKATKLIMKL